MNFFKNIFAYLSGEDGSGRHKLTNLTAVILLVVSVLLTINILQLRQELRQRAGGPSCQNHAGDDCGNNGKSCCNGLTCVPKQNGTGGKCQAVSQPTSVPPTSVPPTSPPNPTYG